MSTVDRVQSVVMSEMLRGSFAPGSWIRQDELAHRLGVSKIPVREALQRMAALGLVRFETNRGAVIPELSAADAEENYELRMGIEKRLLAKSIPNLSIVDLAEAEMALTATEVATKSKMESNWVFHRSLYQASGWNRGLALAEILHATVAPYVLLYIEVLGGAAISTDEHRSMLTACREGDINTAIQVLDDHMTHAAEALINFLETGQTAKT